MIIVLALILLGFFLGVVVVVAAEAFGLLWLVKRLRRTIDKDQAKIASKTQPNGTRSDSHQQLLKKEVNFWFPMISVFLVFSFVCFVGLILLLGLAFCVVLSPGCGLGFGA